MKAMGIDKVAIKLQLIDVQTVAETSCSPS